MDHGTGCSSLAAPGSCPECGADTFLDGGCAVCPVCTVFVLADAAPPNPAKLTRDQAFAKVEKLLWWHAGRYTRAGSAGFGTSPEEFVSEATVEFLKGWSWFSGRPEHLSTFVGFTVKKAAQRLRRLNPDPVGVSLTAFDAPDDLLPDRTHHAGPGADELDELRSALDALAPGQREAVQRYYGVFGYKKHTHAQVGAKSNGRVATADSSRNLVAVGLRRLSETYANRNN